MELEDRVDDLCMVIPRVEELERQISDLEDEVAGLQGFVRDLQKDMDTLMSWYWRCQDDGK